MYKAADVFVPDYVGRKRMCLATPNCYAVPKDEHIRAAKAKIAEMKKEIAKLEAVLQSIGDTTSVAYQRAKKRLTIFARIKQDCEDSVRRTLAQMELERRPVGLCR